MSHINFTLTLINFVADSGVFNLTLTLIFGVEVCN